MGNHFICFVRSCYGFFLKNAIVLWCIFVFSVGLPAVIAQAQCPVVDNSTGFGLPALVCPDTPITLTNPMSGQARYEWNFCANEIENTPSVNIYASQPIGTGIIKPTIVSDNGEYFLFVLGAYNNTLLRMDLGSNPENYPTNYTTLSNSNISGAGSVAFYKEGVNWYALVGNFGGGKLSRVSFGTSLKNTPSVENLGNLAGWSSPTHLEIASDGTNVYAWFSDGNSSRIDVITFGSSIKNSPTIAYNISLPPGTYPYEFRLRKDCTNNIWSIFGIGAGITKYYRLRYDVGFGTPPTITTIPNAFTFAPAGIDFVEVNGSISGYVIGFNAENAYINLGTGCSTSVPTIQELPKPATTFPFTDFIGISLNSYKNKYFVYIAKYNSDIIFKLDFNQICQASIGTSTAENPPPIQYHSTGTFPISLKVYNAANQLIKIYKSNITVNPTATVAAFQAPDVCVGQATNFVNTSVGADANVSSWSWDFGDFTATSSAKTPSHTYTTAGNYNAKLTVTNANGCITTSNQIVRVSNGVTANFLANPTYCAGQAISFSNTSTATNVAFDETNGFYWDFGDGTYSPFQNPTKTYTTTGNFSVSLVVKDKAGCTSTITKSILVINAPTASFTFPNNICAGTPFTLTNTSLGSISSYQWSIETQGNSTQASPVVTFPVAGQYDITLTVTSTNGCQISYTADNIVVNALPKPNFIFQKSSSNGLRYSFTNQSVGIGTFSWDFGDGTTSNAVNPIHTYARQGEYNVRLTSIGAGSCVQDIVKIVQVGTPNYDISIQSASVDANGIVQISFKNNSNFSVDSLKLVAEIGSQQISRMYVGRVLPDASGNDTFAIPLDLLQKNPYVCLKVFLKTPLRENNLENNISCFNLSGNFQVFSPFPNPASKSISVAYTCPENDNVALLIYDASGKKIVQTLSAAKGYNEVKIDISAFYTGIYIFQFQYKGEVFNKKVVISQD